MGYKGKRISREILLADFAERQKLYRDVKMYQMGYFASTSLKRGSEGL